MVILATLIWFGFYNWSTIRSFQDTLTHDFRALELQGLIMQLDEVLTMSAKMNVVTGDKKWKTRYEELLPIFNKAIEHSAFLVPFSTLGETEKKIELAHESIIEMEKQAMDLTQKHRVTEAREIIFGRNYQLQKGIYATAIARVEHKIRQTWCSLILLILDFIFIVFALLFTYKAINRWKKTLDRAMAREIRNQKQIGIVRDLPQERVMELQKKNIQSSNEMGFTTKKKGHGFGLHGSILAAQEMHGNLWGYSAGVNKGATFTLVLPYKYQ